MKDPRGTVTTILYGAGTHRRFTQDGPVLPDVWAEYLQHPHDQVALLLEPWLKLTPFDIVKRMQERMGDAVCDRHEVVYNRTTVLCRLTLKDLVAEIIPLTGWYVRLGKSPEGKKRPARKKAASSKGSAKLALPTEDQMWEDVVRPAVPSFPHPGLLAFVRIAGVIAYLGGNSDQDRSKKEEEDLDEQLAELHRSLDGIRAESARRKIAQWVLTGWRKALKLGLPQPDKTGLIYSINRNRAAMLALTQSVKTVKGDAAARLFSIKSMDLTWAIVDCGIDATHPAFLDRSAQEDEGSASALQRLRNSRVKQTYDFTQLKELLRGTLPGHHRGRKSQNTILKANERPKRHGIIDSMNDPFQPLVLVKKNQKPAKISGLSLTVLCPFVDELEVLRKKWKQLRKKSITAAFKDASPYNLSSIVVLAEYDGKKALLTGDARGDKVLNGLRQTKLLKNDKLHVDLLKLPHHGSQNNVTAEFFQQVTADTYVVSGDHVKFPNPHETAMKWLANARGNDPYVVYCTYDLPYMRKIFKDKLRVPKENNISILADI